MAGKILQRFCLAKPGRHKSYYFDLANGISGKGYAAMTSNLRRYDILRNYLPDGDSRIHWCTLTVGYEMPTI